MDVSRRSDQRDALRPFVRPSTTLGLALVAADFAWYVLLFLGAVLLDPWWLRLIVSVLAGYAMGSLFVLGHDAAHNSLTAHPKLNRLLGYLCFLPVLHNYSLWRVQHNRLHHRMPNVQGKNSWTPFSPGEYKALPVGRRALERFYRSGLGFGLYYLVERWWRHKFWPHGTLVNELGVRFMRIARRDFALLLIWIAVSIASAVLLARLVPPRPAWEAVLFGVITPFMAFNFIIGKTTYLQHTHPETPWFRTEAAMRVAVEQEDVTVNVVMPRWYGWLSHEIMEHTAHHVHPLVPSYRLRAAQLQLRATLTHFVVEPFTLQYLRNVLRRCKLYDYERAQWTDFMGEPTARQHQTRASLSVRTV